MNKDKREEEFPIWGLAKISKVYGVSRDTLKNWIESKDQRVSCVYKFGHGMSRTYCAYPSKIKAKIIESGQE